MSVVSDNSYALIILAGELGDDLFLSELAQGASIVLCADSAAEHARRIGVSISAIVGDLDSVSPETLDYFRTNDTAIVRVEDQESNDFEKTFRYLQTTFTGDVRIAGLTGKRTDHQLTNLSVMLRYQDVFDSLIAYDQFAEYRFLTTKRNRCELPVVTGTTISLLPFGEAHGIVTTNLQYPVNGETLRLGEQEGLSNVATGSPVTIEIRSGALLVSTSH